MNLNTLKRRMALILPLSLALLAGIVALPARAADGPACEQANRERQLAEIDHATGHSSEKELKEAKEKAYRECGPKQ